ncbi:MAG: hypothetical protein Q7V05_11010 [Methanoregula sp.]|nr:hypothetical protein [Methanoregula sp.]
MRLLKSIKTGNFNEETLKTGGFPQTLSDRRIILNVYTEDIGNMQAKILYRIYKFIIDYFSGCPAQKGSCLKIPTRAYQDKKWRASSRTIVDQRLDYDPLFRGPQSHNL